MFKRVPGTKDILPDELSRWQELEACARAIFALYHYAEIRPPLIEDVALFNRSLGTSTEIVQKQMFLIQNKEDTYALRPEGTASIVRAYIENNLDKKGKISKFFYMGPMFRLERPQKGRLRQFHHIGCEVIGSSEPGVDIEVIALARQLLERFGITGYRIKLNTLGCAEDKKKLAEALRAALRPKQAELCDDCRNRLESNVLRILDCKQPGCKNVVAQVNVHNASLCDGCVSHFERVKEGLAALAVPYEIAPQLVRGLDYYTRTVFEITHDELGAQDAIGAGGRYDKLVSELGGPDLGAVGFAFGVERLCLISGENRSNVAAKLIFVIPLGQNAAQYALPLLKELRDAGIACDTDYDGRSLKSAMRQANDYNARFALIIGDNELAKGVVTLKDMSTGQQQEIRREELINQLQL